MALPLPDGVGSLEPVLARMQGCVVEILGVADGVVPWWYRLRGGHDAAVIAGRVHGEERALFFEGECRPAGSLRRGPPGRELHMVRFAGAHLVTALAGGGAVERQWSALSRENSSCGRAPESGHEIIEESGRKLNN